MKEKDLLYIYCITKATATRVDVKGIHKRTVFTIPYLKLAAIASKVKYTEFNKKALIENLNKPEWAEKQIKTHAAVTENVMTNSVVLPLKFATLFKDDVGVKKMLRANYVNFLKLLARFKDKQEWGIKVYADKQKVRQYIKENDEELKRILKQAKNTSMGRAYLFGKKAEEELNKKVTDIINTSTSEIYEALSKNSEESKLNKNLPKDISGKNKEMILNSVFLVQQDLVDTLRETLNGLLKKYEHFELDGEISGPWPAYNFL